jgi:hypothetical protein
MVNTFTAHAWPRCTWLSRRACGAIEALACGGPPAAVGAAHAWRARGSQANSIVEAQLRESFEIGHPTPAYGALLQAVPLEFVGAPGRLRALVELLSAGVAATFAAQARRVLLGACVRPCMRRSCNQDALCRHCVRSGCQGCW